MENFIYKDVTVPDSSAVYNNSSPPILTKSHSLENNSNCFDNRYTLECPLELSHHIDEQIIAQGQGEK